MFFSNAREGFLFYQRLRNHSPQTIEWYDERLKAFDRYLAQLSPPLPLEKVTKKHIEQFLAALQNRDTVWGTDKFHKSRNRRLSIFTVHGYVRALAAFFRWAVREEYLPTNPMQGIPRPKLPKSIKPRFSEADIQHLMDACKHRRKDLAARDRAIILLLLDSGMRAGELCTLTVEHLDPELRRAHVTGKGMKDRYVPIGLRTRQALWAYLDHARPTPLAENVVFLSPHGNPLTPNKLNHVLTNLGKRAGVTPCNPHRFRHTMARLYLRNGGDVMTLQQILGHADLSTTRIYLQLEREDVEKTHERASPVDRLRL